MARDGKAVVTVVGGCGGLCLAQEEGLEFQRALLQIEAVLGPLSIA